MNNVFGIDAGFRKTGIVVIRLGNPDWIIHAETIVNPLVESLLYKATADIVGIQKLFERLDEFVDKWKPKGVFVEMPSGASQGARAARCMALASAAMVGFTHCHNLAYEYFLPVEVETILGIKLERGTEKGMKAGEKTKLKKERSKAIVLKNFPDFDGWPKKAAEAEDAYDAAAAFLAGRTKNSLYARLKGVK